MISSKSCASGELLGHFENKFSFQSGLTSLEVTLAVVSRTKICCISDIQNKSVYTSLISINNCSLVIIR